MAPLACRATAVTFDFPMQHPNVSISGLRDHIGATVTVRGWVAHLRSSGKVAFVVLRDGSGTMQAVVVRSVVPPESWDLFATLTIESSVAVTGEVRADARAPGGFELSVARLELLGP